MMQRDRKREGLRVCRAAWLVGATVQEYRGLEAGVRFPTFETWDRICKLYGWPQMFLNGHTTLSLSWRRSLKESGLK
jgi:helix-turn-helix protein